MPAGDRLFEDLDAAENVIMDVADEHSVPTLAIRVTVHMAC